MHSKWIRRISFFRWFFGLSLYKKFVQSPFLGRCLKYFRSKLTDSCILRLKGESLFLYLSFFLSVCKRCFIQTRMFFLSLIFLVSHFLILLALIGHCDSLLLHIFCQTFAADTGRFWADGILSPGWTVGYPAQPGLTWRNRRLPSPTRINLEEP